MPAKVDRLRRNVSCTEAKLRAFSTRAHVFTQIHGCSSRHNATTGLASYEHFLRTQAQRIRLWTPQLQQYCGSRSSKCAYRERPSFPPFPLPFSTSDATAPSSQPQPAMHRHPFALLTFFRLCTSPFKRRDCSLHILWGQPPTVYQSILPTSQLSQPSIHPWWIRLSVDGYTFNLALFATVSRLIPRQSSCHPHAQEPLTSTLVRFPTMIPHVPLCSCLRRECIR